METAVKTNRTKPLIGIVAGLLLFVISPCVALWLHFFGMQPAFDDLAGDDLNPKPFNRDINAILYAMPIGIGVALIGLIILIVSIVFWVRASCALAPPMHLKTER